MTGLTSLSAIILAAGLSNRLPSENKLLKPLNGKPLLSYTLQTVSSLNLLSPIIVTGVDNGSLSNLFPIPDLQVVTNPTPQSGMMKSIVTGLSALPPDAEGFFIILGDMPFVAQEDFKALAQSFHNEASTTTCSAICVPTFEGKRGHPVLFARDYKDHISSLKGDKGAKQMFDLFASSVIEVPCPSNRILQDFDTLEDFNAYANN